MGYFSELAIDEPRRNRPQQRELPGSIERQDDHNARIVFVMPGGAPDEIRYFGGQAEALRAKKQMPAMSYRAAFVQYWHSKELIWIG